MIAIIDYGAGNLFSVKNALEYIQLPYLITNQAEDLQQADALILPGVGAFPYAMKMLNQTGLVDVILEQVKNKPLLGICLGMQMLFEESHEFECCRGLGLISGTVDGIQTSYKIPHMGWNQLHLSQPENPLLHGISEQDCVYFVHSYMAYTDNNNVAACCDYGITIPALVNRGNVYGAQFHPEKSGEVGLQILRNFGGLIK